MNPSLWMDSNLLRLLPQPTLVLSPTTFLPHQLHPCHISIDALDPSKNPPNAPRVNSNHVPSLIFYPLPLHDSFQLSKFPVALGSKLPQTFDQVHQYTSCTNRQNLKYISIANASLCALLLGYQNGNKPSKYQPTANNQLLPELLQILSLR